MATMTKKPAKKPTTKPVKCEHCQEPIPKARLDALPGVKFCVKCVDEFGPKKIVAVEDITAQPSLECQNGFAPSS